MNKLGKSLIESPKLVPEEGQRDLLPSSGESIRWPSLCLTNHNENSIDEALDYLAEILVDTYLEKNNYVRRKN
jgi:hypothetical protein